MRLNSAALVLGLAMVTAAGCLTDSTEACQDVQARFVDGVLLAPAGERTYDGSDMTRIDGSVELDTHNGDNTGTVVADLQIPQGRLEVAWTDFHSDVDWKDGGIAAHVVEHGASGHGHRMEPEMRLCSGAWGTAEATLDGAPLLDPVTGETLLNAHYMLSKDAMLDPETLGVYQEDGQTPYDPQNAADGHVTRDREEGHFAIWGEGAYEDGHAVGQPEPNTTMHQEPIPMAGAQATHAISVDAVMTTIEATVSIDAAGLLDVEIRGPDGQVIAEGRAAPGAPATLTASPPLDRGDHQLVVSGTGTGTYEAQVTVTPPAPLLIHAVFLTVERTS